MRVDRSLDALDHVGDREVGADRQHRRSRIHADHADAVRAAGDHARDCGAVEVVHRRVADGLHAGEVGNGGVGRAVDHRRERRLAYRRRLDARRDEDRAPVGGHELVPGGVRALQAVVGLGEAIDARGAQRGGEARRAAAPDRVDAELRELSRAEPRGQHVGLPPGARPDQPRARLGARDGGTAGDGQHVRRLDALRARAFARLGRGGQQQEGDQRGPKGAHRANVDSGRRFLTRRTASYASPRSRISFCAESDFGRSSIPSLRLTPGTRSNWTSP